MIVFLQRLKTTSFICTGGYFKTFTKTVTYNCLEVPCVNSHLKGTYMKQY